MHTKRTSRTRRTASIAITALAGALALAVVAGASRAGTTNTAAAAVACKTSGLVVWIDTQTGNAGAGSVFFTLRFTNQSGHTCVLHGYPGVSAVNLASHQLGSAAARDPSATPDAVLANGASAGAQLRIAQAANFPRATCRPGGAAGLRVYPPNQTAAKVVPIPFDACTHAGPIFLRVKAVARSG